MSVSAGAASAVLPLPAGLPLGGYAVRKGVPSRTNTELTVRVLVIDDGAPFVIVSFDLLYATAELTARIRRLVHEDHGIRDESILVCATHTHCGPRDISDRANAGVVLSLAECARRTVTRARSAMRPVRIVSGESAPLDIGRNRRTVDAPVRDTATILLLEEVERGTPTGRVVGTVVNLACHPTVLEHDTSEYSSDFVGALRGCVEQAVGGLCLYLQGFAGDTNPVFTAHNLDDCRRVGARAAGPIIRELSNMLTTGREPSVINLSQGRTLPVPTPVGRSHSGGIFTARGFVKVDRRHPDPQIERPGATMDAIAAERWVAELMLNGDPVFNSMDALDSESIVTLEVLVGGVGPGLVIIALPGEPMTRSHQQLVDRLAGKTVLTVGYANGGHGYLPDRAAYAASGYEVGCSFVAAGTVEQLIDEALRLVPV